MRLVIHAGFGKTGSSSIQFALDRYASRLAAEGIVKFGEDLSFDRPGIPQGLIEQASANRGQLREAITSLILTIRPEVSVLSAENLSLPQRAELFSGVDDQVNTHIIFYVRPQYEWIPSAWKQWYLKDGTSLKVFAERCLLDGTPNYLPRLREWQRLLPKARIEARPLNQSFLSGGDVVADFFAVLGSSFAPPRVRSNESFDYSLLDLMARRGKELFSGYHDVELERWLLQRLPPEYRRTNAPMLNQAMIERMRACFLDQNLTMLGEFSQIADPANFIASEWSLNIEERAYLDMPASDVEARALGILSLLGVEAYERFGMDPQNGVLVKPAAG